MPEHNDPPPPPPPPLNAIFVAVFFARVLAQLAGPNMLSTQVQALVRECFSEVGAEFRRQLRRDIIAVR